MHFGIHHCTLCITFSANRNFFLKTSHCCSNYIPPTFRKFFGTFFFHFAVLCHKEQDAAANADVFSVAVIVISLNFVALSISEGQEGLLDWTSVPGGLVCQWWLSVRAYFIYC